MTKLSIEPDITTEINKFKLTFRHILNHVDGTQMARSITDLGEYLTQHQGKHLRTRLLFLAVKAAGGQVNKLHWHLAGIIELIHNAALLHDDILDEATSRRHHATFNRRWDNETSILYGDLLLAQALKLINHLSSFAIRHCIIEVTNAMCCGELTHTKEKFNLDLSESDYMNIIRAKTARLFELACYLGSYYAGYNIKQSNLLNNEPWALKGKLSSPKVIKALTQYGLNFGMAYQIMDDCMDLVSTEKNLGKTVDRDLTKGKITLPIIRLIQSTPKKQRPSINKFITTNTTPAKKQRLAQLLTKSQSLAYAYAQVNKYVTSSKSYLKPISNSPDKKSLVQLADNILLH